MREIQDNKNKNQHVRNKNQYTHVRSYNFTMRQHNKEV